MPEQISFEAKWKRIAEEAKAEAATLPPGPKRDALLLKARQLETATHINNWISSPQELKEKPRHPEG